MSVEFLEIRPRFKKVSPFEIDELLTGLNSVLDKNPEKVYGQLVHHHARLKIPDNQVHFWSPQLSLIFEKNEKGDTIIRGLYGPSPNVWLLFMFLYFFLGFVVMVLLIVGISRMNLGLTAYILWAVPFVLGGIFALWAGGKAGRKLGNDQIWQIHNLIKPKVLEDSKDWEEDW